MYATRTCKSSAAMTLHIRRKAFSYGYNSLLLKQQYRGITIHKHFVLDRNLNAVRKKDIERSYDLLLSETTSDVQALSEASSSTNHQSTGEVNGNSEPSKWDSIKQKFNYPPATSTLKDLDNSAIDTTVTLHGYLTNPRIIRNLVFLTLVDFSGGQLLQVVSMLPRSQPTDEAKALHEKLTSIKAYTPVAIVGNVLAREVKYEAHKLAPLSPYRCREDMELVPSSVHILNDVSDNIMFTRDSTFGLEDRHLQLRTDDKLWRALRTRAEVASLCRSELESQGFLEVETPLLFKSTPEGAREFLVPTRQKGHMYALPQSPQQYKQILMASGVRRYYQFAKCFRDEDLRADRQPEFTQLDLEMAFAGAQDVMAAMENVICKIWEARRPISSRFIKGPFRRLPYKVAMSQFGSDKPDLRYDHSRIQDVTIILPHLQNGNPDIVVEAFALKTMDNRDPRKTYKSSFQDVVVDVYNSVLSRPEFQGVEGDHPMVSFVGSYGRNTELLQRANFNTRDNVQRFLSAEDNQIVFIQPRSRTINGGNTQLGLVRDALLKEAYSKNIVNRTAVDSVLWVTEFPLFKPVSNSEPGQGGEAGLASNHHPFTAPRFEDIPYLQSKPLEVRAEHFDLVVNGVEVGGGSARIHDPELQSFILKDVIKVPEHRLSQFDHLLKVLASGCPPHAGMALGYDRLIAIITNTESVRDVIAFPKNGKGHDLLIGSPGVVGDKELEGYFIKQA